MEESVARVRVSATHTAIFYAHRLGYRPNLAELFGGKLKFVVHVHVVVVAIVARFTNGRLWDKRGMR